MQGLDPELTRNLLVIIGIFLGIGIVERILEKFLPLLSPKKNGNGRNPGQLELQADVRAILKKVEDLHVWHAVRDDDGVFIWYTRRSMYEVFGKLVAILQEIRKEQRETRNAIERLARQE